MSQKSGTIEIILLLKLEVEIVLPNFNCRNYPIVKTQNMPIARRILANLPRALVIRDKLDQQKVLMRGIFGCDALIFGLHVTNEKFYSKPPRTLGLSADLTCHE